MKCEKMNKNMMWKHILLNIFPKLWVTVSFEIFTFYRKSLATVSYIILKIVFFWYSYIIKLNIGCGIISFRKWDNSVKNVPNVNIFFYYYYLHSRHLIVKKNHIQPMTTFGSLKLTITRPTEIWIRILKFSKSRF